MVVGIRSPAMWVTLVNGGKALGMVDRGAPPWWCGWRVVGALQVEKKGFGREMQRFEVSIDEHVDTNDVC